MKLENDKEQIIEYNINNQKIKGDDIIEEEDVPVSNYPYEFYEERPTKNDDSKIEKNKEEKKVVKPRKVEKKKEEKLVIKTEEKKEEPKKEEIKLKQRKEIKEEPTKIEMPKIEISKKEEEKKEMSIIEEQKNEEDKNKEILLENVEYKTIDNPHELIQENKPPQIKENKLSVNDNAGLPKTLLTRKTEDNYDLMLKLFKKDNISLGDIDNLINYEDFSSDKFLGLATEKIEMNNKNKEIIKSFLERIEEDTKRRQENKNTINKRIKLIEDCTQKKMFFENPDEEKNYFNEFYQKQMEYKKNHDTQVEKLKDKLENEESKKNIPSPKFKHNLDYFKNGEAVECNKYNSKEKNSNGEGEIEKEKSNGKDDKVTIKNNESFGQNKVNYINIKNPPEENILNNNKVINNGKKKKLKSVQSDPLMNKKKIKLTQKEIEDLTNRLHYDGELLKIKKEKKISEENYYTSKYNNSYQKLNPSSIYILIKKLLYEYSTSVKKNTFADYTQNPKLNYEQFIDILKDLYYLENDALPEEYLDSDTMYKELWNKLTQFSKGPENSIESNVLLLYLLELNGFFNNEQILNELGKEIYWIKLDDYDDLIANAKYIEENWDDFRMARVYNIRKLKLEGKYNPIHNSEIYNIDNNNLKNNNANENENLFNNINANSNHYLTTMKGTTNYHMIHGYNLKNKKNDNSFTKELNKKEENKKTSTSINNLANKNLKNRVTLKESYNALNEKRKIQIENKKDEDEKKMKEICTFKPQINHNINKSIFSNIVKVELPKNKRNKKDNLYINSLTQNNINNVNDNNNNSINNTISNSIPNQLNENSNVILENKNKNLIKRDNHNFLSIKDLRPKKKNSQSPKLKNGKKNQINNNGIGMKRNKSSMQKMFDNNPLKVDKTNNNKNKKTKESTGCGKIHNKYYNYVSPMRFDIEHHNKHEGIGLNIIRDINAKLRTQNVIFYNIKINDQTKTLKYIEGEDLKMSVINFVRKNKLPEEVTDIILTKIKEKNIEEL